MGNKKSGNRTGAPRKAGAGRRISTAKIRAGAGVFITQVCQDGTADLGRGRAAITGIGHDRIITIPQEDGSEIRIIVVSD